MPGRFGLTNGLNPNKELHRLDGKCQLLHAAIRNALNSLTDIIEKPIVLNKAVKTYRIPNTL